MGALSLTNGALLGGLALLTAPIMAHLLQRRARRPIIFPSIAFLQECAAQHSKLHRLKRLILLSLRMLAVACIVMAFTRPVWLSPGLAGDQKRDQAAAVVFLIDASVSTTQGNAGGLFEQLKGAAQQAIGKLRAGTDVANVVVADGNSRSLFPKLSPNLSAIASELARLRSSEARADLSAALAEAGRQLEAHSGARRLVILSDYQMSNWSDLLADSRLGSALPPGTAVTLASVAETTPGNVGLSGPECFPVVPSEAQSVDLSINIENAGDDSRQALVAVNVTAAGGGGTVTQEQTVSLGPRESRRTTFALTLPVGNLHTVVFQLRNGDGLAADNQAFLVVGSSQPLPVLVVSDDSPDEPGTAAFYLMRALAPFDGLTDAKHASRLAARHLTPAKLTSNELRGVGALFLGYMGVLREDTAKVITDYVREGGGVVFFSGDGPAEQNLTLINKQGQGTIAPWTLTVRRQIERGEDPLRITSGRWQSRWFREFDERSQLAFREIGFRSVWASSAAATDAEVLLLFSNGQPALGGRSFGKGQFLLANFSPETSSSDFGKQGSFVALAQIMAATLHRATSDRIESTVGGSIRFPALVPTESNWAVVAPDRSTVSALRVERETGSEVLVNRVDRTGIYQLTIDGKIAAAVAVNLDSRETDLRPVETRSIEERLDRSNVASQSTSGAVSLAGAIDLQGKALWGEMFSIALGAIAIELLLLGLWRR